MKRERNMKGEKRKKRMEIKKRVKLEKKMKIKREKYRACSREKKKEFQCLHAFAGFTAWIGASG